MAKGSGAERRAGAAPYRLLRRPSREIGFAAAPEQRTVIDHDGGRLKVLAGPGTGKTATIVEAVADRILRRGVDPSAVLVLTFSRRAAAELSARIAARLAITVTEPIVRTVHSYAYSVVRSAAVARGDPAPRLLEAGQADLMVREMLAGHADDGGRYWPDSLRPALRVHAFAAELRETVLRLAEQRISPRRIDALGRRMHRPEWCAVAHFIDEYRDIGDLRQGTARLGDALDQAELTAAALDRLAEPRLLAVHRARFRRIFVDEYQDVDPAQADLIDLLSQGADEFVAVGDPDQAIYAFRGASPRAMDRVAVDDVVALTACYRMAPAVVGATRRVAASLPGRQAHRDVRSVTDDPEGVVEVRILHSAAQQGAFIADRLRRAHAEGAVPWSQMAVLLRAPLATGAAIRRALTAAGVPVSAGPTGSLAAEPLVSGLLAILRAAVESASLNRSAIALLTSPVGGLDPLTLRRLRRGIRAQRGDGPSGRAPSSTDLIVAILRGEMPVPDALARDLAEPLGRMARLVAVARDGAADPAAENVLWRVWQESGLAETLAARSDRGGRDGERADANLDAAIALFGRAADLATQLPSAGVRGLLEILDDEQISAPDGVRGDTEAVAVLSAHAAKGLEWDVVAVAAVQEDSWPDLRPRSSLLGMQDLLDAAAGVDVPLPAIATLADERRLFYVAATRARQHLIVTAVDDSESTPSRFLAEIAGDDAIPTGWPHNSRGAPERALTLPALVADLRRAVCEPPDASTYARRSAAARALARLAGAGIRSADPANWYGLADQTSREPLVPQGAEVTLSPSQIESMTECPLRTTLERNGGRTERGQAQVLGIAVHALAEGMAAGATESDIDRGIDEFLEGQDQLPPWEHARLRRRIQAMRQALATWIGQHTADRRLVGSEVSIDLLLPGEGAHPVRLRGRIDWLSVDTAGRVVITDFKTGSTPPTKAAAEEHPQLAVYQLAAALGALARTLDPSGAERGGAELIGGAADGPKPPGATSAGPELGGAELVYLSTGKPVLRFQHPPTPEAREELLADLRDTAESSAGARFLARQGEYCARCPVRASCPVQPEGRQVTR